MSADPLYKERSEVVLGKKEVPVEYADRSEEAGEGAPEPAAAKEEAESDQEPGIPGFWLGAMRAHPLISEHVSHLPAATLIPHHVRTAITNVTRSIQDFCHQSSAIVNLSISQSRLVA